LPPSPEKGQAFTSKYSLWNTGQQLNRPEGKRGKKQ